MSDHAFVDAPLPLVPRPAVAALVRLADGRYLLQLRDDIPGIWYPDHWGLFGGAIEAGETPEQALVREVREELGVEPLSHGYFMRLTFDFAFAGLETMPRDYFEVTLPTTDPSELVLGEGRAVAAHTPQAILQDLRVVPYDAFALFLHINNAKIKGDADHAHAR
ncbi:NUDIX domain-containing protein [Marinibaculum pumilum]|uniref:NUDIX domain-containing protein n=1 Tax=Marinibaculum pumilum TaxID=1766165 RepID=A0ABV7L4U4_9PROT